MSAAAPFRIRAFRPGDEVAVGAIAQSCFAAGMSGAMDGEGAAEFAAYIYPEAVVERQSGNCFMLVAEAEGELIGVAEVRDCSHLSMLFVSPEFQGSGVGGALLRRALGLAVKASRLLTGFTVNATPGAVEIYNHWGFTAEPGGERKLRGVRFVPMKLNIGGVKLR